MPPIQPKQVVAVPVQEVHGDVQGKHEVPLRYFPLIHPVQVVAPVQEVHGELQGLHVLTFIYSEDEVQWHYYDTTAIFEVSTQLWHWVADPEQLAQGGVQDKHEFPLRYFPDIQLSQ